MKRYTALLVLLLGASLQGAEPWFEEAEVESLAERVHFDGVRSGLLLEGFQMEMRRKAALGDSVAPSTEAVRILFAMWDSATGSDIISIQSEFVRLLPEDPSKVANYSPEMLAVILSHASLIRAQIDRLVALGAKIDGFGGLYNKAFVMAGATVEENRKMELSMAKERQQVSLTNLVGAYRSSYSDIVDKMRRILQVGRVHHTALYRQVLSALSVDDQGLQKLLADLE